MVAGKSDIVAAAADAGLLPAGGRGGAALLGVPRRPLRARDRQPRLVSPRAVRVSLTIRRIGGLPSRRDPVPYIELQVTTCFSFLYAASQPHEYVLRAH